MAEILLDEQGPPVAPASGKAVIYPDSVSSKLTYKSDSGLAYTLGGRIDNASTTFQTTAAGTDTYVTGSSLAIPPHLMQVGTKFRWRIGMTKSAAGTAAWTTSMRVGTAGTVADTARATFTQVALQTAVADTAYVDVVCVVRTIGAAGTINAYLHMAHVLAATGFSTLDHNVMEGTVGAFDMTVANLIVGLSINPGALGVFTFQTVDAEAVAI